MGRGTLYMRHVRATLAFKWEELSKSRPNLEKGTGEKTAQIQEELDTNTTD